MLFDLEKQVDRQQYKEYCNELYKWGVKKGGVVEIKKRHPQRSLPQNAYAHVCMSYFASQIGLTLEETKFEIFKKQINPDLFVDKRVNKQGKEIKYIKSISALDSAELSLAITRFRNYSSKEAGIYIPGADEYKALIEAEKEIARCSEFL